MRPARQGRLAERGARGLGPAPPALQPHRAAGREALDAWREDPTAPEWELRDAGLLKLFLGADPVELAESQIEAHTERLAAGCRCATSSVGGRARTGVLLALEAGIGHEREYLRFWRAVRDGDPQPGGMATDATDAKLSG